MGHNSMERLLLSVSIGGFVVLAVSFMLMPIEALGFAPGILFWGGLLIGIAFQFILAFRRRATLEKYNVRNKTAHKARIGVLSFSSNRIALIADICLGISAVATVLAFILTNGVGYICYACISVLVLSFCMHCILNGRIYSFVKNRNKFRLSLEQKDANSMKKGEGKNENN